MSSPRQPARKQATTGTRNDWHLDLTSLPRGDPEYRSITIAQSVYTGHPFAVPPRSTKTRGEEDTGKGFRDLVASAPAGQGPLPARSYAPRHRHRASW